LNTVFEFFPPTPFLLSLIFGILLLYFIVVETMKHFFHEKDLARGTKELL
jgi:hypothetical protein